LLILAMPKIFRACACDLWKSLENIVGILGRKFSSGAKCQAMFREMP